MRYLDDLPGEGRVGKSETEGELHDVVIAVLNAPAVLCLVGVPESHYVRRFVPAVTEVYALAVIGVGDVFIAVGTAVVCGRRVIGGVQPVPVRVIVVGFVARTGPRVDVGRRGGQVIGKGVRRLAGRGDAHKVALRVHQVVVDDLRNGLRAVRTGGRDQQAGVQPFDRVEEPEFHDVGRVDEHDDVVVHFADIFEQRLFLGGYLQVGAGIVRHHAAAPFGTLVLHLGTVVALARNAADDHDGGVGVIHCVFKNALRVIAPVADARLVQTAEFVVVAVQGALVGRLRNVDLSAVLAFFAVFVEFSVHVRQFFVVADAELFERREKIGRSGVLDLAGTGPADDPVDRCPAENVDLRRVQHAHGEQGVAAFILVFEEHGALALNLFRKCRARFPRRRAARAGLIADDESIDRIRKDADGNVQRQHDDEDHGADRKTDDPECFCLHVAYFYLR